MQTFTAFSSDCLLMIFRALNPHLIISQIARPDACANLIRSGWIAGISAPPGRLMPRTSAKQHMVLAVPKKEQDPQDEPQISSFCHRASVGVAGIDSWLVCSNFKGKKGMSYGISNL
jgi:hypothetical protein